ncbi:dihydroorotase [Candidatus Woesearchaeota archaeon CG08_land_8_20_14_0_20_47_9]|nr:MAG: dihydroorotase [Candidatus Woesearchaeota archaeon CG1_02_47_18]PIO03431.1 MAG: dihydroorotase [Candidatus Woesearchaeota archaeon CG08_land_8_20_14_0_20_47_9]HII29753.1 dihydroorotase [Candidatus Woesearchaeota archaeon]
MLLISNSRVIDPKNRVDDRLSILVDKGRIVKISKRIKADGAERINANGLIACPGLIDMHVHMREPGREDKETIDTCSRAAAHGGFCTIVGMPNTSPVADNQTVISHVLARGKNALVNVHCTGCITKQSLGQELAELADLKGAGAIAFSDDGRPVRNPLTMRRALEYCKMLEMLIISHSEDLELADNGVMHEGWVSTMLGLRGKPEVAETVAISRDILLAESVGARIHITHVSCKNSLNLISAAKKRGVKVTADTCPHYFSLTDEAVIGYNQNAKVNPPLRSAEHVAAIKRGLASGVIDAIATDHAPHTALDKFVEFDNAESGMVGLETAVPLVMTNLVAARVINLRRAIELLTIGPARILGLDKLGYGSFSIGAPADITIIDPNKEGVVNPEEFESKGRNTPFAGMELRGWPVYTIVKGEVVMRDGRVV